MVDIDILDKEVKKSLDSYFSGVTDVKTEIISVVEFKNIEKKILDALDEAIATIDVCVAWFTNVTLQKKLLEKKGWLQSSYYNLCQPYKSKTWS